MDRGIAEAFSNLVGDDSEKILAPGVKSNTDLRLEKIENRLENLEISDREDIIIVDGIRPNPDKPLIEQVCDDINKNMDVDLDYNEVLNCTFIGKDDPKNKNPRSIRLKVNDSRLKRQIIKRKGQLRGSRIFVKEHLTSKNNHIFYLARNARRYGIYHHVWSDNGRVWASY